jgi:hypothetical protein
VGSATGETIKAEGNIWMDATATASIDCTTSTAMLTAVATNACQGALSADYAVRGFGVSGADQIDVAGCQ